MGPHPIAALPAFICRQSSPAANQACDWQEEEHQASKEQLPGPGPETSSN